MERCGERRWPASVTGNWNIIGNQSAGVLVLVQGAGAVGSQCKPISGTIYVVDKVEGFYCPGSGRISYLRTGIKGPIQHWSGNMSQVVPNQPLRLGPNDTNQLVSIEVADVPNDTGPLRAALHDTEPEVRLAALRAFARTAALDRDAVRSAAQYAVNDADPSVQSTAHEILAHVTAMENATNDFDLLTIGNNAAVSETPADSVP